SLMSVSERQLLQAAAYPHLFVIGFLSLPSTVVARTADSRQLAQLHQRQRALHLHLLFDHFENAVPPLPFFRWRNASTSRKACSKKSMAACCRPTNRSRSAMVAFPCRPLLVAPFGRPGPLKACSPLFRTFCLHRPITSIFTPRLCATTEGFSPFS